MQYSVDNIKDFNTDHIFDCGQCFRWVRQEDGSYIGPAMGKVARVSYNEGTLTIDNADENDFIHICIFTVLYITIFKWYLFIPNFKFYFACPLCFLF